MFDKRRLIINSSYLTNLISTFVNLTRSPTSFTAKFDHNYHVLFLDLYIYIFFFYSLLFFYYRGNDEVGKKIEGHSMTYKTYLKGTYVWSATVCTTKERCHSKETVMKFSPMPVLYHQEPKPPTPPPAFDFNSRRVESFYQKQANEKAAKEKNMENNVEKKEEI